MTFPVFLNQGRDRREPLMAGCVQRQSSLDLRRVVFLGVLTAAASGLQLLEAPLPRLLPWLKPGLSNALVLVAILRGSLWDGFSVAIGRSFLTGIFLGTLFSPPHLLSIAGGLSATLVMAACVQFLHPLLGIAGTSVLGALANNAAQLWVVGKMFAGAFPLGFHVSVMMWVAIPAGLLVAGLTREILNRIP